MFADKHKYRLFLVILIIALLLVSVASLCIGQYKIPAKNVLLILLSRIFPVTEVWNDTMFRVVMYSRLPRVAAALLVGGALALAGSAYQGVFRNPLVSPDLLGVSNGACVGAAVSILLGLGYFGTVSLAFIFGIVAVTLTVMFPRLLNRRSAVSLVLSGVIVGGFFSSVLGLLKYIADADTELAEITYWQLGSLSKVKAESLFYIAPVILLAGLLIILLRWRINVISLGEKEAQTLGINLFIERGIVIACSTVLTAASVCISGTIGWIGLIMPHLARMIVGQNNERVIPSAALLSSIFLIVVDLLARNITGAEIPLSIITGFVGTPFFAFVIIKQNKEI